jgi:hypothetical protein
MGRAMVRLDLQGLLTAVLELNGGPVPERHAARDAILRAVAIPIRPAVGRATSHEIDGLAIDR